MSSFENPVEEELLRALELEMDQAAMTMGDDDLRVAARDGQKMLLDAWEGEDFRQALLAEYAKAKYSNVVEDPRNPELVDDFRTLASGLYVAMHHFKPGGMTGGLFAVEGRDYLRLSNTSAAATQFEASLLQPEERIFGTIEGIAYEEYITLYPGGIDEDGAQSPAVRPVPVVGPLLTLKDVSKCDADEEGYGREIDTHEEVYLPICANGLRWFTARTK